MAFPNDPLDTRVELNLNGEWADITDDVYLREDLIITRGRADESSTADPSKCTFLLDNRSGKYSPRNPYSPLYGKIGRNTPVRVIFPGDTVGHLQLPPGDGDDGYASTPSDAALNISNWIDVKVEVEVDDWTDPETVHVIAMKGTPSTVSWSLFRYGTQLAFQWYGADGTEYYVLADATGLPNRVALQGVVVADLGGSYAHGLAYSTSMSGPWTALFEEEVAGGTTIRSSTGALTLGTADTGGTYVNMNEGTIHRLTVRNVDTATTVVDLDMGAVPPGATNWTDATGRLWTISGTAQVNGAMDPLTTAYRFTGEVASWPSHWDPSGNDSWISVEAGGLLRRLGQGAKPLESPIRRRVTNASDVVAYWPMEDVQSSTEQKVFSPIPGAQPMRTSGFSFSAASGLPGSAPVPTVGDGAVMRAEVPPAATGAWRAECYFKLDSAPSSAQNLFWVKTTGATPWSILLVELGVNGESIHLWAKDADGESTTDLGGFAVTDQGGWLGNWTRIAVCASQSGSSWSYKVYGGPVGTEFLRASFSGTGTVGMVSEVRNTFKGLDGLAIGHISVHSTATPYEYPVGGPGFSGELTGVRLERLALEAGVSLSVIGDAADTPALGNQPNEALVDVMQDAVAVDGGILTEDISELALLFRTHRSMYNQAPRMELDYTRRGDIPPGLTPVDDDQATRNDVTVSRSDGGFYRVVREDGPLSTAPPPLGVGVYDEDVTLNLHSDTQCGDHAGWRLHLGTWDSARYPTLELNLAAAPHLIESWLSLRLGDRITIANPPAWLAPDDIDLIVQGYEETIGRHKWLVTLNCSPAGPYTVPLVGGNTDTEGSQLDADVTTGATTLFVATTSGPAWTTDPADLPFDIHVTGETMTVTAISGTSPQTFTVTRGVNGVTKAHSAGAIVGLEPRPIVAL
ncbi:hypothetical protein ACFPA8_07940 [Streptomyces ovatisporus]|uniref:Minor tail protein n=1 Tax=Streptomyces ovatisporus TaxID=1128682 RepID=A0ABV9A283_9ACTN